MAASTKVPVQQLKEYHDKTRNQLVLPPKYEVTQTGSTFTATCTYNAYKTVGHGTSKNDARHEAAKNMLYNQLGVTKPAQVELPAALTRTAPRISVLTNNIPTRTEVSVEKYANLTADQIEQINSFMERSQPSIELHKKLKLDSENFQCAFDDVNIGLKEPDSPVSTILRTGRYKYMDPMEAFEEVMREMQLMYCCEMLDTDPDKGWYVAMIKMGFNSLAIGGTGKSREAAVMNVCEKALSMLVLMKK